jgi:hypothetical protein
MCGFGDRDRIRRGYPLVRSARFARLLMWYAWG